MTADALADLTSHRIEGRARQGNTPFAVPLISHIDGNLWMGGCIDGLRLPDDFDFVVSLYSSEQYELGPDTVRVQAKLYDSAEIPDERQLRDLAKMVNAFRLSGKTLVHCQAGLNRSALITALALVLGGETAEAAVKLLREKRCDAVLCNAAFERYILDTFAR